MNRFANAGPKPEAAPVDVLAVMGRLGKYAAAANNDCMADDVLEARAAVAELIEESRAVLSVMHAAGLNDAALRAALARIGGAK